MRSQDIEIRSGQTRHLMKTDNSSSDGNNPPSAHRFNSGSMKRKRFSNDMDKLGPKRHCFFGSGHLSTFRSLMVTIPLQHDEELAARYITEMMNRTAAWEWEWSPLRHPSCSSNPNYLSSWWPPSAHAAYTRSLDWRDACRHREAKMLQLHKLCTAARANAL